MRSTLRFASVMLFLVTTTAFGGPFSQFVSITPDTPDHLTRIKPRITLNPFKEDSVTVTVPLIPGHRKYWLIVCKEPVSAEKQNFRKMLQTMRGSSRTFGREFVEHREEVLLIAPLTMDEIPEAPDKTEDEDILAAAIARFRAAASADIFEDDNSITIELALEMAKRSYIYVDYPFMLFDGGYYWAVDIPSYVKRLKIKPEAGVETPDGSADFD